MGEDLRAVTFGRRRKGLECSAEDVGRQLSVSGRQQHRRGFQPQRNEVVSLQLFRRERAVDGCERVEIVPAPPQRMRLPAPRPHVVRPCEDRVAELDRLFVVADKLVEVSE